ncbi:MAG: hypothetical protein WA738_13260 [Candidatus Angelobacter sp.]
MGLSSLLGPLQNLLGSFQAERHYRDDKKDAALSAINTALIETKKYIEESDGKRSFNRSREYQLSQLWADAAAKARYASVDLSQRMQDKSLYWSDNLEWPRDVILDKGIDIDSIQTTVRDLLKQR